MQERLDTLEVIGRDNLRHFDRNPFVLGSGPARPAVMRVVVIDTGIGIAPELHGALFEDFIQVDSPLQKRLRGTGLGLSLCKRFAALLGGEVGMDSTPGVGSNFFVTIPLALALENADES